MSQEKSSFRGLVPLLIFIFIYLGTGCYLQLTGTEMAFYQLKTPVAIFVGIISAFVIFKGNFNEKFDNFLKGCGNEDIIIMCIVYLLAGAFAQVSSAMGGVDSAVNFALDYISPQYIAAGIFVIAGFISTATGTSVGAIVSLGPIGVGLAEKSGVPLGLVLAALLGGAIFGDNLSVISDTTIAATRTQGVEMRDKFRVNLMVAAPAALITIILLIIFGKPSTFLSPEIGVYGYSVVKILPYILVLGLSLIGMNVFFVLTIGILSAGFLGLILVPNFSLLVLSENIYTGFVNMTEIFLLSLLTGGLAQMVKTAGGINWLIKKIQTMISGKKSALIGIGVLVGLVDMAVANNTVAIIINGPIAKKISDKYQVDPRKTATILDIFSCVAQGLIPYGAQMLILIGFAKGETNFFEILPFLWYQGLLFILTIISIFVPFADYYINKYPWNFEKGKAE